MIFKIFLFNLFLSSISFAYIPPGLLVLQKTVENNGSGTYQIEQEVQFQTPQEPFVLKETWIIENDHQMKLFVVGTKEQKDLIKMSFIYSGSQKTFQKNSTQYTQKISDDFFEKYFHFRNTSAFANSLIQLKITPASILLKKRGKKAAELEPQPENFIRLSRFGGVVNYAFGIPTPAETTDSNPGLWIEQDQYIIRKIRLPSQVEITAEKHSPFPRGLYFPRKRSVRWDNNLVQIQTLSVSSKPKVNATPLENTKLDGLENLAVKSTIEEFYKRFR